MLFRSKVDASAIDCQVLAIELANDPSLRERIRILATLGPAPSQPIVVRSGLPGDVKAELRERLLALDGPVLARHQVKRFAAAPDYSAIAAVVGPVPP